MHAELLWRHLGFPAFTLYCEERLGFGVRRAERLIRFQHGLARFPRVRAAYFAGALSYTAALLLLPLLHESTEALWVAWAVGLTYREIERVTELARLFALPSAHPLVFASWVQGLVAQGLATKKEEATAAAPGGAGATAFAAAAGAAADPAATSPDATAFATAAGAAAEAPTAAGPDPVPLGYPLPPTTPRGLPAIAGFPADLALVPPEPCLATIRFFLPPDALDLAYSALARCRQAQPDPLRPTWVCLERILLHLLATHDSPELRAFQRRHPVLCRDGLLCTCPGCTSHSQLEDHHLKFRSQGGPHTLANRTTRCAAHHNPGVHTGTIEIGGVAPDQLITRLGIDPKTGRAFAAYHGERRISDDAARAARAAWRRAMRRRTDGKPDRGNEDHD